ncbi:MAG: hypothetical protein ACPHBR_02065 [Flavobacteriales bacterium]
MALALLTASAYVAFFLVRWNTPLLHRLALSSVGVLDGMLSDGDDDAKLQALEAGTGRLLRALFAFLALLAASALLLLAPTHVLTGNLELLGTWQGIVALSVGGTLALVLPRRMHNSPAASGLGAASHSALDQLLHRMLLNHPHVHLRLMRREIQGWRKGGGTPRPTFLWVTGLARAGTTSVLERLVATGAFHSLNYANMPLVLAPGLWKRFHNPGTGELQERSHGDGILVGLDSAEALEEVFFQAMTGRSYVTDTALEAHDVSPDLHSTYLEYQGIALASSDRPDAMYVAKNNNALLRYPAMRRLNRDFHAVVLFRDPLTHAESLRAMHRKYVAMQADDPFVKEYMDWLAHHEFGLGHKPFRFPSTEELPSGDLDSLDCWLGLWINHYREALALDPHRLHFVSYEAYCVAPQDVLQRIVSASGLAATVPDYKAYSNEREVQGEVLPERLAEAQGLYDEMVARGQS